MIIWLHEIPEGGLDFIGTEAGEILGLDDVPEADADGSVRYDLHAQVASGELVVKGSVFADLKLECARCGVFFSTNCGNSAFLRAYPLEPGRDEVDVTNDLRESVLLEMPAFPVCLAECKGLCPYCGMNLNEGDCGCEAPAGDGRWDALDDLEI